MYSVLSIDLKLKCPPLFLSFALSQTPSSFGRDSPEQRSFRDRQKYFEIDVKQQTPDKPKPRISLVGEDDLKKMKEEEGLCLCTCQVYSIWISSVNHAKFCVNDFPQQSELNSEHESICWMKMRRRRKIWQNRWQI